MAIQNLDDAVNFISTVEKQGYWNDNTAQARRTAWSKLFSVLEDAQKNVDYVLANLDAIKVRFLNLNREVTGTTVDEYIRRAKIVLTEFQKWSADRAGWERDAGSRGAKAAGDSEKKKRTDRKEQPESAPQGNGGARVRKLSLPLRKDFEVEITLPWEGLTKAEVLRISRFLAPYANDWEPEVPAARAGQSDYDALEDAAIKN
jgi:hypothetical protein